MSKTFLLVATIIIGISLCGCNSDEKSFKEASAINTISSYTAYIRKHPKGKYVTSARVLIDSMEYLECSRKQTIEAFQNYLELNRDGKYVDQARQTLNKLKEEEEKKYTEMIAELEKIFSTYDEFNKMFKRMSQYHKRLLAFSFTRGDKKKLDCDNMVTEQYKAIWEIADSLREKMLYKEFEPVAYFPKVLMPKLIEVYATIKYTMKECSNYKVFFKEMQERKLFISNVLSIIINGPHYLRVRLFDSFEKRYLAINNPMRKEIYAKFLMDILQSESNATLKETYRKRILKLGVDTLQIRNIKNNAEERVGIPSSNSNNSQKEPKVQVTRRLNLSTNEIEII